MYAGRRVKTARRLLGALAACQILFALAMTGTHMFRRSELRAALDPRISRAAALERMRGAEYRLAGQLGALPLDARILLVTPGAPWFLSYYLLPRASFYAVGVERAEDLSKLPPGLLDRTDFVLLFGPDGQARLLRSEALRR